MQQVEDIKTNEDNSFQWEEVPTGGKPPGKFQSQQSYYFNLGPLSHHSSVVYEDSMYLFGGSQTFNSND